MSKSRLDNPIVVGAGIIGAIGVSAIIVVVALTAVFGSSSAEEASSPRRAATTAGTSGSAGSSSGAERAPVRLSGRGDDVQTMILATGVWFCDVSVSGNSGAYGATNFAVELTGRNGGYDLLANEIATAWVARKRLSVGGGVLDFGAGMIDVEITAVGRWEIDCARQ